MKIKEKNGDIKGLSVIILQFGLAGTIVVFVTAVIIKTGMMLAAMDILIIFIVVFSFWALLVYILTGEFPIHFSYIAPRS